MVYGKDSIFKIIYVNVAIFHASLIATFLSCDSFHDCINLLKLPVLLKVS